MSNTEKELLEQILKDKEIQSVEDLQKKIDFFKDKNAEFKVDNISEYIEKLKSALKDFETHYEFRVGDILVWKSCMNNKMLPKINQPVIVIEVFKEAIFDTSKESSSTYFQELLDMKIGLLHPEDNVFITYFANSQRYRPLISQ
jgi:hypothetical protein